MTYAEIMADQPTHAEIEQAKKTIPKTKTVAMVGFRGVNSDVMIQQALGEYLLSNGWNHIDWDHIDLNNGRDFLDESKQYDAVTLLFVYVGDVKSKFESKGYHAISPKSSWYNWRQRLLQTKAEFIFTMEGTNQLEISARHLGELEGYKRFVLPAFIGQMHYRRK